MRQDIKESIKARIDNCPLLRPHLAMCDYVKEHDFIIITDKMMASNLADIFLTFPNINIKHIILMNYDNFNNDELKLLHKEFGMRPEDINSCNSIIHDYGKILFTSGKCYDTGSILACKGILSCYMYGPVYEDGVRFIPDYFEKYEDGIIKLHELAHDNESREILCARIKSFRTGSNSYFKISQYPAYFPPEIVFHDGDVVIDCGLGWDLTSTFEYSKRVGENGKVYAFEPDPESFENAQKVLASHENVVAVPAAVAAGTGVIEFCQCGGGASFVVGQSLKKPYQRDVVKVKCETLDKFVSKNKINRVDHIKFDIEGAELGALHGAENTIRQYKPSLAICLYHNDDQDAYKIIEYLSQICVNYTFFLGHHCTNRLDWILYGVGNPQ